jgi:hypothetical protein
VPNKPKQTALPGKKRARKRDEKKSAESVEKGSAILDDLDRIDSLWLVADTAQREEWISAIPEQARMFVPKPGARPSRLFLSALRRCSGTRAARGPDDLCSPQAAIPTKLRVLGINRLTWAVTASGAPFLLCQFLTSDGVRIATSNVNSVNGPACGSRPKIGRLSTLRIASQIDKRLANPLPQAFWCES